MSESSNAFSEDFLRRRLAANRPDSDLTVVDKNRSEVQYTKVYEGVTFTINRGHAYKDHATGPTTNARFGGPPDSVENAIMKDALRLYKANMLSKPGKISAMGTGIIFRHIPIRYNAISTGKDKIIISDYMVWQGTISETWDKAFAGVNWPSYD